MSDFQKQQRPGATPIKNPLLSASVTGLTFDDFPNKPLLLPAAPAVVHPPVPTPVITPSVLVAREPKSLVTVGSSSLDTESLDEINLNSSNDDNQTSDGTDPNANPLLLQADQSANSDSILSQAASSFSALPSVASNVLSTFSKRITAISSRETTPVYESYQQDPNANTSASQLHIQPTFIQQSHQADLPQAPPSFYTPALGGISSASTFAASSQQDFQNSLSPPEPPKFYTPAEVPAVPSISAPPTNLSGQNNFRFSSKKKLYAPIPGLSDESQKPPTTLGPSTVSSPISYDTSYGHNIQSVQTQYSTDEERKPGGGLFSKISNLAPTGVLQNITGLVQSAAGSLTQTNKTESYHEVPPPVFDQQHNFFAVPPPPTNYFVPPSSEAPQNISESSSTIVESTNQGTSENSFQPQSQTQIPLFNTSNLPTQPNQSFSFQSAPQPSHASRPPANLSSAQLPPKEQSASAYFNINQSHPAENTSQVPFFDPTKYLPLGSQSSVTGQALTASQTLPPPLPPASGQTSYRLQKGTKLYKNPLTPQETTPIQVTPNQIQCVNTYSSQEPFAAPQSVPLFAPPIVREQTFLQSVPSAFAAESVPNQSTKSVPLFVPPPSIAAESLAPRSVLAAEELKSTATSQNLAEFRSSSLGEKSKIEEQAFAPPIKKLKSEESQQDVKIFDKLLTNEPKQSAAVETKNDLESIENKIVANVPKEDSISNIADNAESQPIFEPIEPVLEENITDDPLEETLQKLSLAESSSDTKTIKLPPIAQTFNLKNPYRRGSATEAAKSATTLPILANFFTPDPSTDSTNLNFFTDLPSTQSTSGNEINFFSQSVQDKTIGKENSDSLETTNYFSSPPAIELTPLEPETAVHPPISAFFPTTSGSVPAILEDKNAIQKHLNESFSPPIGFENITKSEATTTDSTALSQNNTTVQQETTSQTEQPEIVNRFSNYFNQANNQQSEITKDPLVFFDSFSGQQQQQFEVPTLVTNEEQRIQYFFNNPPPKDAGNVGDLNYDLVHSGLGVKNLQYRSLTPISNLVEPPSSACSEFSELSNSTAGQKSFAADLSINESSDKLIEYEETNRSIIEDQDSQILNSSNNNVEYFEELPEEFLQQLRMASLLPTDKTTTSPPGSSVSYTPAVKHWFFKRTINDKQIWVPFSHYDSALLETSHAMEGDEKSNVVAVEGGRYDVNISERKKMSVYWDSQPIEVRRCSWFYKAIDSKYVPYEEETAELLESEYKQAAESGVWHKTIILGMGEKVVFHGPTVIVHFQQQQNTDAWGGTTQTATRPRVVKRDLDDFNIEQGESQKVDHLLFMVHGIGSACDLKLRSVEEVVEDFRTIAHQLVQSHYKNSTDFGLVGRVEVLPISWHSHLHSVEEGIDEKLRMITLESIPKLRNFTNDTLLDILFYTSPTFCQKIMNTIVSSLNTLYLKYRERHPEFNGGVSLAGHSLGSLILFDLLCHQNPIKESEDKNLENPDQFLTQMDSNQMEDSQTSYTTGPAGTGQPFINYAQLIFQPKKFFALGSPIGMFVTIRGIDKLGLDFRLPTCPGFYNIFHPYDPVAYRIEALVNPDLSGVRPVLIPHHKGRKRMHLELKETMTRVTMDLKNRFLDKFKTTLDSVNIFGSTSKSAKEAEELMEKEVDKVIRMQIQLEQQNRNKNANDNMHTISDSQNEAPTTSRQRTDSSSTAMSDDMIEIDFPLGKLNDSKRIDYVLQEAPLEFINEYIFALSSHVCYWDSEDTILFVMKEIYSGLGISPDSQVPQQTMTIERPSSRNSLISSS